VRDEVARVAHRIVDADVHHVYAGPDEIAEFLPSGAIRAAVDGDPSARGATRREAGAPAPNVNGAFRLGTITPSGGLPGSDPLFLAQDHLDRFGIEYAILNCGSVLGLSSMHDIDHAIELQRAVNDWTIEKWLPADERYLGSVTVATSDPHEAAAEIRRVGTNPRMVQVCVTGLPCPMGNARLHPIYEACDELELPLSYHVGFDGHDLSPTTFVEVHVDMCYSAFPHLTSLVLEGVFEKFPGLTVIFSEFGMAWLPFLMWRMDTEYRAGRDEVPWLTRLPSEYVADHVRFTTQPLEEPPNPKDLATFLSIFPAGRILLFSSDYPHWDADSPEHALRNVPEELHERIFFGNAWETFRLEERLAA
jgi:predicted TIM-barrel fold metal-dependent hydrolase